MNWWEKLVEIFKKFLGQSSREDVETKEWIEKIKREKEMQRKRLEELIKRVEERAKEAIRKAERVSDFADKHGWGYMGIKPETFKAGFFNDTGCPNNKPRIVPDLTMDQYYCREMNNPIDGCSLYWYVGRAIAEANNALEKIKGLRMWQSVWNAVEHAEEALKDAERANAWADKGLEMMKKYWETSVCLGEEEKKEEKTKEEKKSKKPTPPPSKYTVQRFIVEGRGRIELKWDDVKAIVYTTRDVEIEKGKKVAMKCYPSATITVKQVIWKAGEYIASEPIDVIEGEELTFVADADYRFDVKFK